MEQLIEQLTELKDKFLKLSIELREKDPPHSYRAYKISGSAGMPRRNCSG